LKPRSRVAAKFSGEPVKIQVRGDDMRSGYAGVMSEDDQNLIGPDDTAYRLELTPAQLKITYTALKSLLDDFGHDEPEVHRVIREVLDKLPDEHSLRDIRI